MSSDKTGEQYPTVPVCESCIKIEEERGEDSSILSVGGEATSLDDECYFCGNE